MKKELLFLAALCLASVQVQGQTTLASGTCGAETTTAIAGATLPTTNESC